MRSEDVQSLKDVLNVKYGDAATSLAPSDPTGGAPPSDSGEAGDGSEIGDAPAEAASVASGVCDGAADGETGGAEPVHSPVNTTPVNPDQMETLVMKETEWPPRPWIPKSSLRRWSRSRSIYFQDWFQVTFHAAYHISKYRTHKAVNTWER